MKKLFKVSVLLGFISLLPLQVVAQNWLKIINDGYVEYQKGMYCEAYDRLSKLDNSEDNEIAIAVEVFGVDRFRNIFEIATTQCNLKLRDEFNIELIEKLLDPDIELIQVAKSIESFLERDILNKDDVRFYKKISKQLKQNHKNSAINSEKPKIEKEKNGRDYSVLIIWLIPIIIVLLYLLFLRSKNKST